jgi:hypothetical protein
MRAHPDDRSWRDDQIRQHPERLSGLDLRYLLTDLICHPSYRVWAVKDLVAALTDAGFTLGDRPSKAVSDHLRAEVHRGRVRRVGWGAYGPGIVPGATRRRIRNRARLRRRWLTVRS